MRPGSIVFVALLAGCSEYDFGSDVLADLDAVDTAGGAAGDDTAAGDTGDTVDTSVPEQTDTAPPPDQTEDPCYQSDHGYDVNPAARLFVDDGNTPIRVIFTASDSSYNDELGLEFPWAQALGVGGETAPGTAYLVGMVAEGTELTFGIQVRNTGDHFQSGPATRNADGVTHVAMTYAGQCAWTIGFEDLWGGGDQDYNDVELRIEGQLHVE